MAMTAPARPARPRAPLGRRRLWIAGAVILAALGFLVVQALGEATVYFKTADEAVAEKDSIGDRRFRIEGLVVAGSVRPAPTGNGVGFEIRGQRGALVEVVHRGDPPELFQPDIPVVLEGRWSGDHYASDRIMVKHTNEYKAENPDRVDDYVGQERAGQQP